MVLENVYNCDIKHYHMRQVKYVQGAKKNNFKNVELDEIYKLTNEALTKLSSKVSIKEIIRESDNSKK